jgi:hypothetical protein
MCDRRLLFGQLKWVDVMTAKVSRASALAWLGIEPWFVRKPNLPHGFKPAAVAQPLSPHASALIAEPAGFSANLPPPDLGTILSANQGAGTPCLAPPSCVTPLMNPATSASAAHEIAFFAAPDAAVDALWVNIQRCISPKHHVLQGAAASAAEARIQMSAQAWSLKMLRENAAEKKRLWRFIVGIEV